MLLEYSICGMHFSMLKDELISGISVGNLLAIKRNLTFYLEVANVARGT